MTQKGSHTWDLNLRYYRCPKCGYIIEDRQGGHENEISCGRCNHKFFEKLPYKKSWLPIFGESDSIEWDWGNGK